ncbi:MAG: alpha amylase N-terminal ig-like domain-containing protein [Candidatus Bipolaricaulota bacterium]
MVEHNSHKPLYRQPFGAAAAGEDVLLRIAVGTDDVDEVVLVWVDEDTGLQREKPMHQEAHSPDTDLTYWSTTLTVARPTIVHYQFVLERGDERWYYGDTGEMGGQGALTRSRPQGFQLTVHDPEFATPDWMKHAVIYQIFPDRFRSAIRDSVEQAVDRGFRGHWPVEVRDWDQPPDNPDAQGIDPDYDGDGIWNNDFFGGDLPGILESLDYLTELGVSALYLNPIFEAASNHRYDTADYESIDRVLGTNDDFEELASRAGDMGINLILDGVFNHVGDDSRYFDRYERWPEDVGAYEYWASVYDLAHKEELTYYEAEERVREEYLAQGHDTFTFTEWFEIRPERVGEGLAPYGGERYDYDAWWELESLPEVRAPGGSELNLDSFADYIIRDDDSITRRWIRAGASGWRIDVPMETADEFWVALREYLKGEQGLTDYPYGEPVLISEEWGDASHYLLGDSFDSTMNYRLRSALLDFLTGGSANTFHAEIMNIKEDYPREAFYALMNLLGSHDTARALTELGYVDDELFSDRDRVRRMSNEEIQAANQEAMQRLKLAATFMFSFPGAPTIYYGDELGLAGDDDPECRRPMPWEQATDDNELLQHFQHLSALRGTHPVLRTGSLVPLYADGSTYAFGRQLLGAEDALGRRAYTLQGEQQELLKIEEHNALAVVAVSVSGEEQLEIDVSELSRDGVQFTEQLAGEQYVVQDGTIALDLPELGSAVLISDPEQNLTPPPAPQELIGQGKDEAAALRWEAPPDAVVFNVYRTPVPGGHYSLIAEGLREPQLVDEGLENLVRYHYAVTAIDDHGNESTLSEHVSVVPGPAITGAEVREFRLHGEQHLLQVGKEVPPLQAQVSVPELEEGRADTEALLARIFFGQSADPSTWAVEEAGYLETRNGEHLFKGSFVPDKPGRWYVTLGFSTDRGESWTLARYPDDSLPWFEAVLNDEVSPPAAATLESAHTLRRLDAPSHVVLELGHPEPEEIEYLEVLRRVGDREWETLATLEPDTRSYTDSELVYGEHHAYLVQAVERWFHRSETPTLEVRPEPTPPRVSAISLSPGEVDPSVDGAVDEAKWEAAASLPGKGKLIQARIGYSSRHLYVRVDPAVSPREWIGDDYNLVLYIGPHSKAESGDPVNTEARFAGEALGMPLTQLIQLQFNNVDDQGRGYVFPFAADGTGSWDSTGRFQDLGERIARVGETIEFQIPLESLGLDRSEEVSLWTRVTIEHEGELLGTAPAQPGRLQIPALVTGDVVAEFTDPEGDDHGIGTYEYPTAGVFDEKGLFDLLRYTVLEQDEQWMLALEFAALPNPWDGPLGFSHPLIHIYLDVEAGGRTSMHPAGEAMRVRFVEDHPWNYFLRVAGWPEYGRHLFTADDERHLIDVSSDPARRAVFVRIPKRLVPDICGGHYVLVASQDGYGPDYIRPMAGEARDWTGGGNPAPDAAPWAYDHLAPEGWTQEEILGGYDEQAGTYTELLPVIVECD